LIEHVSSSRLPGGTPLLRLALDSRVGRPCACSPMRSRLLFPRSFGRGRGSVSRIERTSFPADTAGMAMSIKGLPAGFVIPAQPVLASRPPSGPDWVHEIKHDGYRMIVHRDGPMVRLYSRNAHDWTERLAAIATAAESINADSFTIDGEAVVLGPDGLSRFEELSRREAARTAIRDRAGRARF
jgi:hypothetical protein